MLKYSSEQIIDDLKYFFVLSLQGQAIAQLLRTIGDVTVYGVCSKGKHEALTATGLVDHIIDRADYVNELRKLSAEGVDIVLDCLCGEECNRGYGLLKPMGKYVLFGQSNVVTGETKSFFSLARSVRFLEIGFKFHLFDIFNVIVSSGGRWTKCPQSSCSTRTKQ